MLEVKRFLPDSDQTASQFSTHRKLDELLAVAGNLSGAVGGLVVTFDGNNFMPDSPHGSYWWWVNFLGYPIALFVVVPSGACGLTIGIFSIKTLLKVNIE